MDSFEPADTNFREKVRDSFSRQKFMEFLGARLVKIEPGFCEIQVGYQKTLSQQHGYFHAGVSGSVLDSACGYAAFSLMPKNYTVLTVEFKLNLIAPADGEKIIAQGRVLKSGKTLKICEGRASIFKGGEERLCACSLTTIMAVANKADG